MCQAVVALLGYDLAWRLALNKDYLLWNLQEAAEELIRTIADLKADPDYGEPEFAVAMTHLYHHLNTAGNAGNATAAEPHACRAEDFNRWRQFPVADLDMSSI
ncbi:MAG TPA: hypothetical protein VMO26_24750 [Vicinamibacterales bacterium]|nr:hypothetical protein [Vicinamibacterales bacterium]